MKKYAIALLLVPLLCLGVFIVGMDKTDHGSSPAFTAALDNAISTLEGTAVKVTSAVTPQANAAPAQDITCCAGFTCDGSYTCDGVSLTCSNTCSTWPTCQANPQCGITYDGTTTCDGTLTCQSTCGAWPTCDDEITCLGYPAYTCDLTPTCCQGTEHSSWGKLKKDMQ